MRISFQPQVGPSARRSPFAPAWKASVMKVSVSGGEEWSGMKRDSRSFYFVLLASSSTLAPFVAMPGATLVAPLLRSSRDARSPVRSVLVPRSPGLFLPWSDNR